jgi:hypothetical protein
VDHASAAVRYPKNSGPRRSWHRDRDAVSVHSPEATHTFGCMSFARMPEFAATNPVAILTRGPRRRTRTSESVRAAAYRFLHPRERLKSVKSAAANGRLSIAAVTGLRLRARLASKRGAAKSRVLGMSPRRAGTGIRDVRINSSEWRSDAWHGPPESLRRDGRCWRRSSVCGQAVRARIGAPAPCS